MSVKSNKSRKGILKPVYAGRNNRGQFIVDEDTKRGVYDTEKQIMQLMYKINQIIHYLNAQQ